MSGGTCADAHVITGSVGSVESCKHVVALVSAQHAVTYVSLRVHASCTTILVNIVQSVCNL